MSHNVLIIEDDRDISHLIELHLKDLSFRVDPQILGGLVVRVGDRVMDGSAAGQLERLHQSLA